MTSPEWEAANEDDSDRFPQPVDETWLRFQAFVTEAPDGCWQWSGCTDTKGYGMFTVSRKMVRAHRYAYGALVGEIPDGLVLDHLCRHRACVNPAHLEPVTNRENVIRGVGFTADKARQTTCQKGHALDGLGTRANGATFRYCRTCKSDRQRAQRHAAKSGATS